MLGADHPFHLVDGGLHGPAHGCSGPGAAQVVEAVFRTSEEGGAPAPVASRRTESDDVPLDDADAQGGVGLGQVVTGPQTGQATTHDGHIQVGITAEGRTLFYRAGEPVPPQGELSEALTRRCGQICFHASVRTDLRTEVISSNSSSPQMSGGANWTTGSPRSSARQMSPDS